MITEIFETERVRELAEQGAALVDALPHREYEHSRLPGAINLPLAKVEERALAELDPSRPVVVYCNDFT